ncbi:putative transcription regulator [Heterobasidion irregulare TC 32-1]|uniref:Putative transcription regulator n=1 Tax=Heterobasidion irregulare (strain TC 32-1) TaxID=747525 RepID=W4K3S6_HETIT|nr:putative transcription regulator [Heterobasidion irregulare TC 32-1]ETW80462.1 putative transcription regulator [Heterobasidion irregulare TC 32-1]
MNTDTTTDLHTDVDAEASSRASDAAAGPSTSKNGRILGRRTAKTREKVYRCDLEGCDKAYTKPSRLAEHTRSHTGHRPYKCPSCSKSYLRDTHLAAHARTHLPTSARPLACSEPGCDKRFWTPQHLNTHVEVMHRGVKSYECEVCPAAFAKHHQLRAHTAAEHAPPGSKPYLCTHNECTKSFATAQKLRAHVKVHEEKRYTCAHPVCLALPATEPAYFPTWTALQHHIRTAHPPTCPHASCNGRTFASHAGLRAHLKVHADADRRRGGEVGRDWRCEEDGCWKEFKSKKALTTHHTITHLGRRDFVCPEIGCARAFGYKHILQRHVARVHAAVRDQGQSGEARGRENDADADADTDEECSDAGEARGGPSGIDAMTGRLYAQRAAAGDSGPTGAGMGRLRQLRCPYPNLSGFSSSLSPLQHLQGAVAACEYAFGRAYDLRRHLEAVHGVVLEKEIVDAWARRVRAGLARGSSR